MQRPDNLLSDSAAQILVYIGERERKGDKTYIPDISNYFSLATGTVWGIIGDLRQMQLLKVDRENRSHSYKLSRTGRKWDSHYRPLVCGANLLSPLEIDILSSLYTDKRRIKPLYIKQVAQIVDKTERRLYDVTTDLESIGLLGFDKRGKRHYYYPTEGFNGGKETVQHYQALREMAEN